MVFFIILCIPAFAYILFRAYLYPFYGYDGTYCFAHRAKIIQTYNDFSGQLYYKKHLNHKNRSTPGVVPGVSFLIYFENSLKGITLFDSKLVFPLIYIFLIFYFYSSKYSSSYLIFSTLVLLSFIYPMFISTVSYADLLVSALLLHLTIGMSNNLESGKTESYLYILIFAFPLIKAECMIYLIILAASYSYSIFKVKKFDWKFLISIITAAAITYLYKSHLYADLNIDHFQDYFKHFTLANIYQNTLFFIDRLFFNGGFLYIFAVFFIIRPQNKGGRFIKTTVLLCMAVIYLVFISMNNQGYLNRILMHYFFTVCYYLQTEFTINFLTIR